MDRVKENIKEVIKRLEISAITSKIETIDYPNCIVLKKDLITILSELDKLKKQNYDLLRKLKNRVKEVRKLGKYSMYKKEFSTLNKKIDELQKENEVLKTRIQFLQLQNLLEETEEKF